MNILFRRMLAIYIDSIISSFLGLMISIIILVSTDLSISPLGFIPVDIFFLTTLFSIISYHSILEWKLGYTLGKKIFKLRVVQTNNTKISLSQSLLRNILRIIDHMFIGYILVAITKESKRLGDIVSKTKIIQIDN